MDRIIKLFYDWCRLPYSVTFNPSSYYTWKKLRVSEWQEQCPNVALEDYIAERLAINNIRDLQERERAKKRGGRPRKDW